MPARDAVSLAILSLADRRNLTAEEAERAFAQVMRTGSETQMAKAAQVLAATRRDLYRILADGDAGEDATPEGET